MTTTSTRAAFAGPLLAGIAALFACLHAWIGYRGFAADEAFVGFRYATRLASGEGLTWVDGPPTEGFASAPWILVLALLDAVGLEPIRAARLLSYGATAVAVWAVSTDPGTLRPTAGRALSGGLLLAASGSLAAWTMGGLELAALAATAALAVIAAIRLAEAESARARLVATALLAALILLRSDAYPLVFAALLGGALCTRTARPWLQVGAIPTALLLASCALRFKTTGSWLPAAIPSDLGPLRAAVGLRWTGQALAAHAVLVLAAAPALARGSPRTVIPFVVALGWPVHLIALGGDTSVGWSLLVPVLPALALLGSEGLGPRIDAADRLWLAAALAAAPLHGWMLARTGDLPEARAQRSEWYAPPNAEAMKAAFAGRNPLLAVEKPGVVPFWTGFDTLVLGAKNADSRQPDLVVLANPREPTTAAGRALVYAPDFAEYHQLVSFSVHEQPVYKRRGLVWVRREGGALGLTRGPDEVQIPGWFLASEGGWAAQWDGTRLSTPVTADHNTVLPALLLRAGTWEVLTEPGVSVGWRCEGRAATRADAHPSEVIHLDQPGHVDLLLRATAETVSIEQLTIRRTEREPGNRCQ